jgi:hypothetical protein
VLAERALEEHVELGGVVLDLALQAIGRGQALGLGVFEGNRKGSG